MNCVVCYNLSIFPIVFPCGHVICGSCYVRLFKLINSQELNSYYTKCPSCMNLINCFDALTIFQENDKHPNSDPSLFYKNAFIYCGNIKCNYKVSLSN